MDMIAIYVLAGFGVLMVLLLLYVSLWFVNWSYLRYVNPQYWRCRIFHKIEKKWESRQTLLGVYSHSQWLKCTVCGADYGQV